MRIVLRFLIVTALLGLTACNLTNVPTPTPTLVIEIPTVEFTSPTNEATVVEGTDLEIDLVASDSGVGVARVELYVDEQKVNEQTPVVSAAVPVFTVRMNWLAQGLGRHSVSAIAYRPDGTQSDPAIILVNVLPEGDAPAATPEVSSSQSS